MGYKKGIFFISIFFVLAFIIPLFLFKFPIQGDDIAYVTAMINNHLSIINFPEFVRSSVFGSVYFIVLSYIANYFTSLNINQYLIYFFVIHFVNAVLYYFLLNKLSEIIYLPILKDKNFTAVCAILFLLNIITIENYTNIAMSIRMIGLFFIFLHYILLVFLWNRFDFIKWYYKLLVGLGLSITLFLAYASYEIYVFFFFVDISLMALFIRKNRVFLLEFFCLTCVYFIIKLLAFYNIVLIASLPSGVIFHFVHSLKVIVLYVITVFVPNVHGKLLVGSLLYAVITIIVFLKSLFIMFNKKIKDQYVFLYCVFLLLMFFLLVSLTHYAPRLLYAIIPIIIFLFCLTIFSFSIRTIKVLLTIVIISNMISLYHFYYLQNQGYKFLDSLKHNILIRYNLDEEIIIRYNPSGVRVFLPPDVDGYAQDFVRAVVNKYNIDENKIKLRVRVLDQKIVDANSNIIRLIKDRLFCLGESTEIFLPDKKGFNIMSNK